jgi:hypothetical protein
MESLVFGTPELSIPHACGAWRGGFFGTRKRAEAQANHFIMAAQAASKRQCPSRPEPESQGSGGLVPINVSARFSRFF